MVFYLVAAIVILTILIYIVTELIHLPKKKFKKYLKFFFSYNYYLYCFILDEVFSSSNNFNSCNIFNTF